MSVVLIIAVALVACLAAFLYLRTAGATGEDNASSSSSATRKGAKSAATQRASRQSRGVEDTHQEDEDEDSDDDDEAVARAGNGRGRRVQRGGADAGEPKLTRLQRKKLEKEKEKAERRQAIAAAQEARHQTQEEMNLAEEEKLAKEAEMAALEEAALEELRQEKKRQDDEEYTRWVSTMGIEESGELGDEQRRLHDAMVSHLSERYATVRQRAQARIQKEEKAEPGKVAELDDAAKAALVASHQIILYDTAKLLGVTVEQLVTVIEQLVREEIINGVFDEHGKFVLLAEEHYPLIAKFIQQRGRVSVTELARECNQIILQN